MKTKEKSTQTITAEEFDRRFDAGEDISEYVDWSSGRRPGFEMKRINLDVPVHLLGDLDREARRRGVSRQSLIKVWLFERLQNESSGVWKIKDSAPL